MSENDNAHSVDTGGSPDSHIADLLARDSFIELNARQRARALLDSGSMRELLGPFDRVTSPWLAMQHIVTQADDGVVIARGTLDGAPTVVLAIEGGFQGGSMGEVGGAKIAGALELAAEDNRRGVPTQAVILFETGGVRLQEANLGLAAIAEIQAAIVDLRRYRPVIGVSAGTVGCYGGMSIAAGLCSYLVLTREARLGLNGPQVIEQEAGLAEFDSRNRPFIWSLTGGEQRFQSQLADAYAEDDVAEIRGTVARLFGQGVPAVHRSERYREFLACLAQADTSAQPGPADVREIYRKGLGA
jgi:malonate decarboxylase beta subunit